LLAKQRKHHGENDCMGQRRRDTRLARHKETIASLRDRQQHTRAESQEQRRGDQEIGLREHETQRSSDHGVHEEEHESVEHDRTLTGLSVHETDIFARRSEQDAGAESQKKGSRDGNFLRCNIGQHLLYIQIIFAWYVDMQI